MLEDILAIRTETEGKAFFYQNMNIVIVLSMLYCPIIFTVQKIIKFLHNPNILDKPLKLPLFLWNMCLCIFSIIGSIKTVPYLMSLLNEHGFEYSVLSKSFTADDVYFYIFIFVLSKCIELIDTLFIVLRNKPLIFLHWYHHATVLIYCWFSYKDFRQIQLKVSFLHFQYVPLVSYVHEE